MIGVGSLKRRDRITMHDFQERFNKRLEKVKVKTEQAGGLIGSVWAGESIFFGVGGNLLTFWWLCNSVSWVNWS